MTAAPVPGCRISRMGMASDGMNGNEVYFDGLFGFELLRRPSEDVEAVYPDIVGSKTPVLGRQYPMVVGNGEHTVTVRAVSLTGDMAEDSARFEVVGFPYAFLSADESPNLEGASVSLDGDSVVVNRRHFARWRRLCGNLWGVLTASQGLKFGQVTPNVTNPTEQDILVSAFSDLIMNYRLLCNQPGSFVGWYAC
ncbi:MAG: hypothetical protein CM15mP74_24180 [Halieaceae bacterium]|nr:MAG: hypothetical protein CM15mP74_24180 [Halieaceae bacterium]